MKLTLSGLACPLLASLLVLLAPADRALAFGNAGAKVQLHLTQTFTSMQCTRPEVNPACDNIDTSGDLYPNLYFAHVLLTDGSAVEGFGGALFGIEYGSGQSDGVGFDIFGWSLCATLELQGSTPPWPASGSANLITWDVTTRCQRAEPGGPGTGVVAHVGYFYCAAYTPATFRIIAAPRRASDVGQEKVLVANCASQEDILDELHNPHLPSPLGSVVFSAGGLAEGDNPCVKIVSVAPTSWSRVKLGL